MMSTAPDEKRNTGQIIWGALVDQRAQAQIASRQVLADVTGFKLTTIDDHVNRWVDDGKLRRPVPGVVEIIEQMPPPRPVSLLHNPDGPSKLEIGDFCVDIWPQERRMLSSLLAGDMVQYSNIQFGQETGVAMAGILATLKKLERANRLLEGEVRRLQGKPDPHAQLDLLGSDA